MKGFIKLISAVSVICLCLFICPEIVRAEETDEIKYIQTYYSAHNIDDTIENGFYYCDNMLLERIGKETVSPDLALISVSLAMSAYNEGEIKRNVEAMGYEIVFTSEYYEEKSTTYEDNDHVAFMIGKKVVSYKGAEYTIYLVPVRGTGANCEWYSNFNLGTGEEHEGFHKAADEVLEALVEQIDSRSENTVIWTMGHSRGAAVANIVAGELSLGTDYKVSSDDKIIAYTYACPSVKIGAKWEKVTNIFNFNNPGDLITAIPLEEEWGFSRYGQTIELATSDFSNLKQRFRAEIEKDYAASLSTDSFVQALMNICRTQEEYNNPSTYFLFELLANILGGKDDASVGCGDILAKTESIKGIVEMLGFSIVDVTYETFLNLLDSSITEKLYLVSELDGTIARLNEQELTDEIWNEWLNQNAELKQRVFQQEGLSIYEYEDLVYARDTIQYRARQLSDFYSGLLDVIYLLFDTELNPVAGIEHAHAPETYVLWLNSMYYGFEGWLRNSDLTLIDVVGGQQIGANCFDDCRNLKYVTISENTKIIGACAFSDELVEVVIPDTIEFIGHLAFWGCPNLKKITIPVDFQYESEIFHTPNVEEIYYTKGKTGIMPDIALDDSCQGRIEYSAKDSLKKIVFEEGVKRIGSNGYKWYYKKDHGFWGMITVDEQVMLEEIVFPSTLESIGEKAFQNQTCITKIEQLDNLNEIGAFCFSGCSALTSVRLSSNLDTLSPFCFENCSSLVRVEFPENLIEIGSYCFSGCKDLVSAELPKSVVVIGDGCFQNCYSLEEIKLSDGIIALGFGCFSNCFALEKIELPEGLEEIGDYCFRGCISLIDIEVPSGVETLGQYCFAECSSLEGAKLPDSVRLIKQRCFAGCTSLTNVKDVQFPKTMERIPAGCFERSGIIELELPETVTGIDNSAFAYCPLSKTLRIPENITVIEGNAFWGIDIEELIITGPVFMGDYVIESDELKRVTIPVDYMYEKAEAPHIVGPNVEEIYFTSGRSKKLPEVYTNDDLYEYRLEYIARDSLRKIEFENGVTQIGDNAFLGMHALSSVILPETVNELGNKCFSYCSNLMEIRLPKGIQKIGEYCFEECAKGEAREFVVYGYLTEYLQQYAKSTMHKFIALQGAEIITQPKHIEGAIGETVEFHVEATGAESYRWYYSADGSQWSKIGSSYSGYNTDTLQVVVSMYRKKLQFCCQITGKDGIITTSDVVWIREPSYFLEITSQPTSVEGAIGDIVSFSVAANGAESFRWYYTKDGNNWSPLGSSYEGYNTDTLRVVVNEFRKSLSFRCIVEGAGGLEAISENVYILEPMEPSEVLEIISQPTSVEGAIGDIVSFSVAANGAESFRWYYTKDGNNWIALGSSYEGYNTDTLYVVVSEFRKKLMFRCVVKGRNGAEEITNVVDIIDPIDSSVPLEITSQPVSVEADNGDIVSFSVIATGAESYRWYYSKDGNNWSKLGTSYEGYNTDTLQVAVNEFRKKLVFRCLVRGVDGSEVVSYEVGIEEPSKVLEITSEPTDVVGTVGDVVQFYVGATGADSYRWYYCVDGNNWKRIGSSYVGYDTDTLQVIVTAYRLKLQFYCEVMGSGGDVVASHIVRIIEQNGSVETDSNVVQYVKIPDDNLRQSLIDNGCDLDGNSKLSINEMQEIIYLDAYDYGISNLTGLEYATELKEVNLEYNQINDLSPLKNLKELAYLYLNNNEITDLTPLLSCTKLAQLSVKDNKLVTIPCFRELDSLLLYQSDGTEESGQVKYEPLDIFSGNMISREEFLGKFNIELTDAWLSINSYEPVN